MPLYEYRCRDCGHEVEVLQKFSDRPLTRCEKCRGKLEKLISRTAFHLKGGGWFDEGYRKSDSSSSGTESKESASVESTTESSSESTGEAKKKSESKGEPSGTKASKAKKGAAPKAGKAGG